MTDEAAALDQVVVQKVLSLLAPDSTLVGVRVPEGSYSNETFVVEHRRSCGAVDALVVRRYAASEHYDRGEKARREFETYRLVRPHGIPAPEPLYLDVDGSVLGTPGIVTSYVPGGLRLTRPDGHTSWTQPLAAILARIHRVPVADAVRACLLNANSEASWFLAGDGPPSYMAAYSNGARIWQLLKRAAKSFSADAPSLVHLDVWPGNILWEGERITGIVDWEEAAWGDPAIDVAYLRMNLALIGMPEAVEDLTRTYEGLAGRPLLNLAFWDLAASVRPMLDPPGWELDEAATAFRFSSFIEAAISRLTSS